MPVPTKEQVAHPKRLLSSDLELHLLHYVHKQLYTVIIMGDMNTDLYAVVRAGKDRGTLTGMMNKLQLVSCAAAVWPRPHELFHTHSGGAVHDDSHIDYLIISESCSGAVRAFGIHAELNLCDNRGGRHAALFADVDVVAVLGFSDEAVLVTPPKRKSQIKYRSVLHGSGGMLTCSTRSVGWTRPLTRSLVISCSTTSFLGSASATGAGRRVVAGLRSIGDRRTRALLRRPRLTGDELRTRKEETNR